MLRAKAADRHVVVAAPPAAAEPEPKASVPLTAPTPTPPRAESAFAAWVRLARDPPVFLCVGLYMGLGMTGLTSAELYPLYVINDQSHGGFGLDSSAIGLLALSGAPWMIVFQAFCFSRLTTAFGVRRLNQVSLVIFAVCMATTPLQSLARALPERAMWAVLFLHYGVTTLARVNCFTCSFVFTANAALPQDRGKVNGLAQAAVSAVRAIGPPLGTAVFAWSVSETRAFPFDYSLAWLLLSLMVFGILAWTFRLPPWIERKRTPADTADEKAGAGAAAAAQARARPTAAQPVPTDESLAVEESEGEGEDEDEEGDEIDVEVEKDEPAAAAR